MTFTPNIPVSGQSLGATKALINGNFTNYLNTLETNHGDINSSQQGKHTFVEMPVQSPDPTTITGEGGLWTKTVNGTSQLFYRNDLSSLIQPVIPIKSYGTFITTTTAGTATLVNSFNVSSVTWTSAGTYTVVMGTNLQYTTGVTEYTIQLSLGGAINLISSVNIVYNISTSSGSNTFTITTGRSGTAVDVGSRISFTVIQ